MDDREANITALAADALLQKAFMIEVAAFFAGRAPDRAAWIGMFISSLHERLDDHERSLDAPTTSAAHELARQRADELGDILRNRTG